MAGFPNPALSAFLAEVGEGCTFGQVRIRPCPGGFELRHAGDSSTPEHGLVRTEIAGLRALAQTTESGAFRPNKTAPNLPRGWWALAPTARDLEAALRLLYPGGLADWFAARSAVPPVTHYREFAARQTGLYRITQILPDALAAQAATACCDVRFCLRRRLWTVPGLAPDAAGAKSVIPCLEPCSLLLDLARCAMKLEQQPKAAFSPAEGDLAVLVQALETALRYPQPDAREGSSADPANSRRVKLLLEKLRPLLPPESGPSE
ncbi:MAG TPA: DR2241 family protein [Candidatus Limnocylindria bacterium]|nr:DR2241 family protein [Candidatus Limnocylindria bacterium]